MEVITVTEDERRDVDLAPAAEQSSETDDLLQDDVLSVDESSDENAESSAITIPIEAAARRGRRSARGRPRGG